MLDTTKVKLKGMFIHKVGNKLRNEGIFLSESQIDVRAEDELVILNFLLGKLHAAEHLRLSHPADEALNEVASFCRRSFERPAVFPKTATDIIRHLYDCTGHPKIKAANVFVALFEGIAVNSKTTRTIGVFRSETEEAFVKIKTESNRTQIRIESGANSSGPDKSALIFAEGNSGTCGVLSQSARGEDAVFWVDRFLQAIPISSEKEVTKTYLDLCRRFCTEDVPPGEGLERNVFLNRSFEYFKESDSFDSKVFAKLFSTEKEGAAFEEARSKLESERGEKLPRAFPIAKAVVKKQAAKFRKNLTLDENIEVRLKFDSSEAMKDRVERGFDKKRGLAFYKLYYEGAQ